jgi:replicative DNA helicase Mcm
MDKIKDVDIKGLFQNKIIKKNKDGLLIDISELIEYDVKLYESFLQNPKLFLELVQNESDIYGFKDHNPQISFLNWRENKDISNLRVSDIGSIVKLDGMVSKVTDPLALIISKKWYCPSCGSVIQTQGNAPTICSCGRRNGFIEQSQELQDIKELILEELQERTGGKQPQKIRVRLTDKLTSKEISNIITPGSRVSIIGLIDKIPLKAKQDEEIYQYRIIAIDITSLDEGFDDTLTDEDLKEIEEISFDNPIEKLKDSLAPEIWGLDDLKKVLLLQMVGGVQKEMDDEKLTRYWTNVLVVGDPSCAKSQLGKNVNLRMPKSFFTSGDNSSSAGLVGAVVRDELLGNWSIEVGPLIKSSSSLLVVDEIDKFPKDQLKALHTPLESGFAQITKAGLDGRFPAETSLLALANPKHGVFEDNKSLVEQINLPPALLSRFDIIYIIKDEIDKESDDKIAEIIYHKKKKKCSNLSIPVSLFRKYITYAKSIKPTLSEDGLGEIQEFYHDVRKKSISKNSNMSGMPIGTRHLQGLIRMAEASAKLRLSDKVEKEDFDLAKKLFYDSLVKIGMDEGGVFDLARISNSGQTISKRKLMDILMDTIRQVCAGGLVVKNNDLKKIMEEKGMSTEDYNKTIDQLNRECSILKEGDGWKVA